MLLKPERPIMLKYLYCKIFGHKLEQLHTYDLNENDEPGPTYIYAYVCDRCHWGYYA